MTITWARDPVAEFLCRQKPSLRISLVIFGAVMIHLSLGTYHTFGNMLPYMASFMRNYTDDSIRIEQLMWIPMFQGCFPLAMVIGGFLASKLGSRSACMLGCFLTSLSVLLSTWTIRRSYMAFLFTYGFMFGLGQGMAYVVAVASVINWTPQMVGFASGIVAAGFGISSSIFAPIQTHVINPDNYPPTKEGYFNQEDLLQRVPTTFFDLSIVYFIMQCIGLIFICDPPSEELPQVCEQFMSATTLASGATLHEAVGSDQVGTTTNSERPRTISSCSTSSESELEISKPPVAGLSLGSPISLTPKQMIKSSTFYFLFISLFCCSFYGNMFYNLYKTFAETFISDDLFMAMAFSIGSVANSIARVLWGFITDRTSFQITLSLATSWAFILLFTMPATALFGKYVFLFWLIMMFICMGSTHALFISAVVRCFGTKHKSTNYGVLIFSTTLSGVFLAALSQHFLEEIGYKWAFIFTAAFPFISFILTSAIRITPQGHLIV